MAECNILSLRVHHRQGSFRLRVEFRLQAPWTVLFGPSGSGKSTVLRAISGFVRPEVCTVHFGPARTVLADREARVHVAPHLRPVRSAAQTARLFPGMRVRDNVAYGVGWRHVSGRQTEDAGELISEVMDLFRVGNLATRWPEDLSGGEQQRVSVARAVVSAITFDGPGHALLLLDEPLSGLDAVLRDDLALSLREFLERWKVPVLSVSHDVTEAYLLRAEVVRLSEGQVVDQGPVEVVLHAERERLLAGLR